MAGSAAKNLRLFVDMCGYEAMPNVVIVTTMWSEVSQADGKRRENQLKTEFWKDMLAARCQVVAFQDTHESAWSILDRLTDSKKPRAHFQISSEIVDSRRKLNETTAGITLRKELQKLMKERQEASSRIQKQAQTLDNEAMIEQLNRQQREIEEKINSTLVQLQQLKVPIARRIRNLFLFNRH